MGIYIELVYQLCFCLDVLDGRIKIWVFDIFCLDVAWTFLGRHLDQTWSTPKRCHYKDRSALQWLIDRNFLLDSPRIAQDGPKTLRSHSGRGSAAQTFERDIGGNSAQTGSAQMGVFWHVRKHSHMRSQILSGTKVVVEHF